MMILKIAWRNIWRNKSRSLVVMGSILVGIWALITAVGFMNGFMVGYTNEAINFDISNIQIHHPDFKTDYDIKFVIPDHEQKVADLANLEGVVAATSRSIVNGMVASPKKATGIQIRGIDKEQEAKVTSLDSLIVEGEYFEGIRRNPIILGKKLAETLHVKLRSKVVLTFNDSHGNITAGAFRVVGIVKSASLNINERSVFVLKKDINKLLGIGDNVHEIAAITAEAVDDEAVVEKYKELHPDDMAQNWREVSPEMALMQDMYGQMLYILMVIILTALIFGIVNTMLMAVLERMKELGMLMAVGMVKGKVFMMIMIETISLAIISAPFGLLAGYFTLFYFRDQGLDLTNYSEGLEAFGYGSILYPYIGSDAYITITIGVIITAFIAAIYPAWKAVKLKPVEALHKI